MQKHDATRLHYDLRLESEDGVLKSWAVPKGPSMRPDTKRLAVMVEDHPFDYLHFEGTIPRGNYGAGTVIVWDTGSYSVKEPLLRQLQSGKVSFELYGHKLKGLFKLIRTKKENQWLLIKGHDRYVSDDDPTLTSPESILSGKSNSDIESETGTAASPNSAGKQSTSKKTNVKIKKRNDADTFPKIKPMLAHPFEKAFDSKDWVFEVKWDGVRAILYKENNNIKIQSRNGNDITKLYPEIVNTAKTSLRRSKATVLDGEIVVLNEEGIPDFHTHQHRMHIQNSHEIMSLSVKNPATYYVFDILYDNGKNLENLGYVERRQILDSILKTNHTIRISEYIEEKGTQILASSKELNLEGIVAKHKRSVYREGIRSRDWLKIKNTKTQDCVIIGYSRGLGSRVNHFGSLVLAVYTPKEKKFKFAGHAGTGFNDQTLGEIYGILKPLESNSRPVDRVPYLNRETKWLKPVLVAEVKFDEWTPDGILRAPVFLRLRDDKKPEDCIVEADKPSKDFSEIGNEPKYTREKDVISSQKSKCNGTSNVAVTNPSKVYWRATKQHPAYLKKDLIDYYDKVGGVILPHLEDRPLSLSRYPNGIYGKSFYQKDWDQKKPEFVTTAKIHSEHRGDSINYIICNNKETILWVANLGCIEMHPWYSRIKDFHACSSSAKIYEEKCGLNFPDFILFDLDPYIYSGKEKKGDEPQYNIAGFKAAVDIAHELKDIFKDLKINSYLKTSGKSGLHIYVPIKNIYSYEQTKSFAETIANIMLTKFPKKVTLEWSTSKRKGKVFFDYNQNARGKTIASAYSVRPTANATVSMPVEWKNIDDILPTDFRITNVPDIVNKKGDVWHAMLSDKQDIGKMISRAQEIA